MSQEDTEAWAREIYQKLGISGERLEIEVRKYIEREKRYIMRMRQINNNQGFRLKFYLVERQEFPEAFKSQVIDSEVKKIVSKLARHFKIGNPRVRFYGNRQSGSSGWDIRLSHNPNLGLICHELAHQKHRGHNKKLMSLIGRMVKYCTKKQWNIMKPQVSKMRSEM